MVKRLFITGIGTEIGKTVSSFVLSLHNEIDYWKPIQAGFPKDSDFIKKHNKTITVYKEKWMIKAPVSPHYGSKIEDIKIDLNDIQIPCDGDIIIESAGGICTPINNNDLMIDIAIKFNLKVILVIKHYLGSINHSLLSLNYIKSKNIYLSGIIFNGKRDLNSEDIILKHFNTENILYIPESNNMSFSDIKDKSIEFYQKI